MLMRHPVTLAHVKAQSYLMYSRNLSNSILNFTENVYCTISHEIQKFIEKWNDSVAYIVLVFGFQIRMGKLQ